MMRILRLTWGWRLWTTLYFLVKGARVSPGARLQTPLSRVTLGRGAKIGKDVVMRTDIGGRVVLSDNTWLSHGVEIEATGTVSFGEGTTVQRRCTFNGSVKIGRGCIIAPNVFASSGAHIFAAWPDLSIREQEARYAALPLADRPVGFEERPVEIGDDCWIGINVAIMPGVIIGHGCIIGANAVVTQSLPPGSIAVGVPAKIKANRFPVAGRV